MLNIWPLLLISTTLLFKFIESVLHCEAAYLIMKKSFWFLFMFCYMYCVHTWNTLLILLFPKPDGSQSDYIGLFTLRG